MGGGFDGSPIVASGQRECIDAIHDAFVVGGGPIGIGQGQIVGEYDAIAYLFAGIPLAFQILDRNAYRSAGDGSVGQVR